MKHISRYNEYKKKVEITQDDVDDIKDVFQDIIDEYDFIYDPNEDIGPFGDKSYNIDYFYTNDEHLFKVQIEMYFNIGAISQPINKNFKMYSKLKKDINDFVLRLKGMGFVACVTDHGYGKDISIFRPDPETLKTFEKFNDKKMNLTDDDYNKIKNVFQNIIDRYDLVEDKNADVDTEEESGIKTFNYNINEEVFEIELWYDTSNGQKLNKEIIMFIKRLRKMGYYVNKLETVNDYITISINKK